MHRSIYRLLISSLCVLCIGIHTSHANTATLAFGYQGISVDKGINLQLTLPKLLSENSGLFIEVSGNETAGISLNEAEYEHKNYLLWHAGWYWERPVNQSLYWTWLFGMGSVLPKGDLEDQITLAGTLRTGLDYQINSSLRSFVMIGVEMNLWNRANQLIGSPYYARGTTSQFGLRYLF